MYRWQGPAPPAVAMIRSRRMRQLFIEQHGIYKPQPAPAVPTMVIDGAEYVEQAGYATCKGCAFEDDIDRCATAQTLSIGIFGGTCDGRQVIYMRKTKETGVNPGTITGLSRKTHKRDTDTAWSRSNSGVG